MDSIFEQPRTRPRPTPVSQNFQIPVVPEASLIFQNDSKSSQLQKNTQVLPPQQQSYNAWKLHNLPQPDNSSLVYNNKPLSESTNSDKICQNYANYQYAFVNKGICDTPTNRSMLKKQVRFERLNIQQSAIVRSPNFSALLRNSDEQSDMKSDNNPPISTQYIPPIDNSRFPNNNKSLNNDSLINMHVVVKGRASEENYKKIHQEQPMKQNFNGNNTNNVRVPNILHTKRDTERTNSERCENTKTENLYQKNTLNSENIKKFTLSEHILGQEKLKTAKNSEIGHFDSTSQQTLPNCLESVLPSKPSDVGTYTFKSHDLDDQSQSDRVEKLQNSDKSCTCNCNLTNVENKSDNKENLEPKSDPTVSELLNVVKLQNEQLQLLQNQVQTLIALNKKNRKEDFEKTVQAIAKYSPKTVDKRKDTTRLDKFHDIQPLYKRYVGENSDSDKNYNLIKKKGQSGKNKIIYKDEQVGTSNSEGFCRRVTKENILTKDTKKEKISVGIMTSFQVRVNPPYKNPTKRYDSTEISSTEDSDNSYSNQMFNEMWRDKKERYVEQNHLDNRKNDYTLDEIGFDESLKVQEPPLSPNHTVHVDMQDYVSDSDDESSEDSGWTFYNNILGQVNNMLENSPSPNARRQNKGNRITQSNKATNRTMDVIKEEALKNLQSQGLCASSNDFLDMNPEEISFAVKQILMKYMSDEELANIAQKHDKKPEQDIPDGQNHYKKEYKSSRDYHRRGNNNGMQGKYNVKSKPSNRNGKILDITTLKKQPKLL